jgi:hypothetical protein
MNTEVGEKNEKAVHGKQSSGEKSSLSTHHMKSFTRRPSRLVFHSLISEAGLRKESALLGFEKRPIEMRDMTATGRSETGMSG